jgi:hypothetical protein
MGWMSRRGVSERRGGMTENVGETKARFDPARVGVEVPNTERRWLV